MVTMARSVEVGGKCKEIIRAMGVPCVETDGPFEAEALAASIVIHGQADFVASEDTVISHIVTRYPRTLTLPRCKGRSSIWGTSHA